MPCLVNAWILLSAVLVAAGWILSGLHEFNLKGYAVCLGVTASCAVWRLRQPGGWPAREFWRNWRKIRHRFKRPAPLLFFLLFSLAFIGGALYPSLGDAAMYRTPRVLHWLAAERWHWIRTFDIRMNIAGCGFEWLSAPLMLLTHTDRMFFFINLISYALLPGLIFSMFRQLRMPAQMAWWWMWLLPAGLCYVFQAATLSNDAFVATYALASVVLALRAQKSGRVADLWISMLAAALTTGAKALFIPLIVLWLISVLPSWRLLLQRPAATAGVVLLSLLISALPMICLNLAHDCNWAGIPNHPGRDWCWQNIRAHSPFWSVIGNLISIPVQNFAPPFFPDYEHWNQMIQRFVESPTGSHFALFESFCKLKPFQDDQDSGLGLALCLLLLITLFGIWRIGKMVSPLPRVNWQIRILRLAPWGLLVLFMASVTSFESARQLAPYYPFLLPLIFSSAACAKLARQLWWQRLSLISMVTAVMLQILSPERPLWPARTILDRLPDSKIIARARSFYSTPDLVFIKRHAFQSALPTEGVVGYATDIRELEPSFWRPFTRRVVRVLPTDTHQNLETLGIQYVVVDNYFLEMTQCSIEQLGQRYNARIVETLPLSNGWQRAPDHVYLLRLNPG